MIVCCSATSVISRCLRVTSRLVRLESVLKSRSSGCVTLNVIVELNAGLNCWFEALSETRRSFVQPTLYSVPCQGGACERPEFVKKVSVL